MAVFLLDIDNKLFVKQLRKNNLWKILLVVITLVFIVFV